MSTLKSFEDIEAWQKARLLANRIFMLALDGSFSRDFKLRDQINGSSGSIMDNIAEGFERDGNREFIQFLSIAKGSAGETRSQLYRAFDRGHISQEEFEELREVVINISKQLSGLIKYLNNVGLRGTKYFKESEEKYGDNL
ncbi:MAG TPA: four helix bundle protein [Ohtaekwangia sp.]